MSRWIRPAQADDLDGIVALCDLAFGGSEEGEIVRALAGTSDDLLSLVASDDKRLIGHIQFFRIQVDGAPRAVGLGPMAVHPDVQKTGIGGGLIQMGLMALEGASEEIVFVLGHTEYYPKFGFTAEAATAFTAPWSGPAFMALALSETAPTVGELTYPPAFG